MLKRILTPIFYRFARSLGIADLQSRVNQLERATRQNKINDETYAALEARFRGSPEVIKERQRQYLPYVRGIVATNAPLLDLGFGRGEWLALLKDEGLPSRGIDSNKVFVDDALAAGLSASQNDLLPHLQNLQEQSIGAVTLFQVAEHLPLQVLESVLREIQRILVPGGVAILEIPNLKTLRVGAGTFWIDPTHIRPLFPEFLVFLVERSGFTSIETRTSTPLDNSLVLNEDSDANKALVQLWTQINGPGDFAVIARK